MGKKIFYSHTFMHYKCDMKIGASRFIRVISLCHLLVSLMAMAGGISEHMLTSWSS